jgi:trk system potassium uptake protein
VNVAPRVRARARLFGSPGRIVVAAFGSVVALGTLLLWLPASRTGEGDDAFLAALFTATSAVCVTGHTVVDTPTYWTGFGHAVIVGLIQVGGFGILTLGSILLLAARRRLGLRQRTLTLSESRAVTAQDIRRILLAIAVLTFVVEAVVAVILTLRFRFAYDRAWDDAAWQGLFHAVSGFNGAGFALYSDSFITFAADPVVLIPVGIAVIIGGLGFPVVFDLRKHRLDRDRWSLHTKITLFGSSLLLLAGLLVFLALEWGNEATFGPMGVPTKVLNAWFQSLSTRSAGFSTIDIGEMNDESWLFADVLMFIGGGSGSTAGGIKVATFVILVLMVVGEARGGRPAEIFRRTIPAAAQRQALVVAVVALTIVAVATLALMALTPFPMDDCLFEAISAFSIVGLSTGITADLGTPGQLILVVLMFVGRIGTLTLVLALAARESDRLFSYPEGRPLIG